MSMWESLGRERLFEQGAHLWLQDDQAGIGAFLVEGVLGVEKVSDRGERVVFTELKPGAILGEMSCLDGAPHSATVKALVPSRVRIFTDSDLKQHLENDTARFRYLLMRQNERLRFLTDKLLRVGTEPVHRRLAYWLCEQQNEPITVTHHELAAQLATTRESVSKGLAKLRKEGFISSKRGEIRICDRVELARLLTV